MPSTLISVATLLTALMPGAEPTAPRNDSICQRDLKADLFFLAGDRFRGRLTATPENDLACEFIASRFERLGLKRVGDGGSYFHRFNLVTASLGPSNRLRATASDRHRGRALVGPGVLFPFLSAHPARGVGIQTGFVGFGISSPDHGHDDYRGVDVRGKIVLVLDHEPGENDPKSPFDGVVMSEAATQWRKALTAQENGAVGILFVSDIHNHPDRRTSRPSRTPPGPRNRRESRATCCRTGSIASTSPRPRSRPRWPGPCSRDRGAARGIGPRCREAAQRPGYRGHCGSSKLSTDVRHHVVPDRNVLAALEGSDPKLKDEWVVISCHHDHNGADGDQVFNGADDNGSGVVGLLEIAEAYALAAQDGHRPKRSILFISFNSEERGLLGSWAFVEHPPVPLDRIVAVLNMDMVGRDEEVPEGGGPRFRGLPVQSAESNHNAFNLLGHSRSASLTQVIDQANARFGLTIKKVLDNNSSQLLRRSDQWPFLQNGVPAVFFHTGLHPDYHTSGDRPERINYPKMERIVRLVHQASWDLAQQPGRPRLDAKAPGTASH